MHRVWSAFFVCAIAALTILPAHAQKAISIGKVVNDDDDEMAIDDINEVKNAIVVSDTLDGWIVDWRGAFKGAQTAYKNWSNGGVNTVSITGSSIFNIMYRKNQFSYAFNVDVKYGLSYINEQGKRKINDRLAVNNRINYLFGSDNSWSIFLNLNFTSQFDQGYEYLELEEPEALSDFVNTNRILISEFMSPAYFSEILGLAYLPSPALTFTSGLALKQTIVLNDSLSTNYGLDVGDNFQFETGFALSINYGDNIMENVYLATSITSFTNINRPFRRTDLTFRTELVGSINDYLSMTFEFIAIYDDDYSDQLQLKQVLAAGLSFTLL